MTGSPAGGPVRVLRGLSLGSLTVSLSAAGHLFGGGSLPGAGAVAGLTAVVSLVAFALAARSFTVARAFAVLALGQISLHEAFARLALDAPALAAPGSPSGGPAGHAGHGAPLGSLASAGTDMGAEHAGHLTAPGGAIDAVGHGGFELRMLLAHIVAALLIGAAVAGVDRVLFLLADLWCRPALLLGWRVVVPVGRPRPISDTPLPHLVGRVPDVSPSRGPPVRRPSFSVAPGRLGRVPFGTPGRLRQVARVAG